MSNLPCNLQVFNRRCTSDKAAPGMEADAVQWRERMCCHSTFPLELDLGCLSIFSPELKLISTATHLQHLAGEQLGFCVDITTSSVGGQKLLLQRGSQENSS